jgi:hypothetical protein
MMDDPLFRSEIGRLARKYGATEGSVAEFALQTAATPLPALAD